MKLMPMLNGIVMLTLTGCAATGPDQATSLTGTTSVACISETDCAQKWQRADEWIRKHSYWPMKRSDDAVIETERPRFRMYNRTRYRVLKETTSNTMAEIRIEASCQLSVYCSPNTEQARAAFVQYLQTGEDSDALH